MSAGSIGRRGEGLDMRFDVDAVLLDVEGTLGPISFVRDTLFPYSRARLHAYVATHHDEPEIADILRQAGELSGDADPVAALTRWHDADEKAAPLKRLQGLIWEDGYRTGAFRSPIYPDALDALRRWKQAGLPLYIYSSGSVKAQILYFTHTTDGDLTSLFSGHFDTDAGPKTDATAYGEIARRIGVPPQGIVFLSDNALELDAAAVAGCGVVQVVKEQPPPVSRHVPISHYDEIDVRLLLPRQG